jgi:hypothetical protein
MVSLLALTAAPLDTAPRPVFAMAFVNAFCTELLPPAVAAAVDAPPAPLVPATLPVLPLLALERVLELVPTPVLVPVPVPLAEAALMPALPLPPMAVVDVVPPPAVSKLEVCAPVAAPPDVLT